MTVEPSRTRQEAIHRTLVELREINLASHRAYMSIPDTVDLGHHMDLFTELAAERLAQAETIRDQMNDAGPEANASLPWNSFTATFRRRVFRWDNFIPEKLQALLPAVERSERYIKAKYEAALAKTDACPEREMIESQYGAVSASCRRVREAFETLDVEA